MPTIKTAYKDIKNLYSSNSLVMFLRYIATGGPPVPAKAENIPENMPTKMPCLGFNLENMLSSFLKIDKISKSPMLMKNNPQGISIIFISMVFKMYVPIMIPISEPIRRYIMVSMLNFGFFTKSKMLSGPRAWIKIKVRTTDFIFIKKLKNVTINIAEPKPEIPCINQLINTIKLVIIIRFIGL